MTREERYKKGIELVDKSALELSKQNDYQMKLQMLFAQALIIVQSQSPYRSGTLARSFGIREVDDGIEIYTNIEYMPYTTEKWISQRWRGRANPNENWFKEATDLIARYIALGLGGRVDVSN